MTWREILRAEVDKKGYDQVRTELGVSKTTVSLLLNDKYPADTARMAEKILRTYGTRTTVQCPVLGKISVVQCRQHCRAAKRYGKKATGNPVTLRLYVTCPGCENRSI